MSTREAAHVEAMWWLLTVGGYSFTIYQPGDRLPTHHTKTEIATEYTLALNDAKTSTTHLLKAAMREDLLDRLVGLRVEQRLS